MRDSDAVSSVNYRPSVRDKSAEFMDRLEILDLLEAIVTRAGRLLGTPDGYLYVVEPETAELVVKVGVGTFKEYAGVRWQLPTKTNGRQWQNVLFPAEDRGRWFEEISAFPLDSSRKLLAVPLKSATEVVGVLCLVHGEPKARWAAEDVKLLERFAELASLSLEIALDNARLYLTAQQELAERKRAEAALRRETDFVKLRQQVAVAANEATSGRDVFQFALDQICQTTGWPVGHVYLLSGSTQGELVSTTIWYLADANRYRPFQQATETLSLADEVGLPGWVLARGQPVWVEDTAEVAGFQRFRYAEDVGLNSAFAFPVVVGKEVVAVLEFYGKEPAEADEGLLDVAGHIGTQLGRVIERQRAEEEIRHAAARAEALARTAARLNSQLELAAVLQVICEETAHALQVPVATISLYDEESEELHFAHAYGLPPEFREAVQPFPRSLYEEFTWQHGDSIVVPDVQALGNIPNAELYSLYQIRTTVSAGMIREGQLIGRLNIATLAEPGGSDGVRRFSEGELTLLRGLADQAAQAIANSWARAERQDTERALRESEMKFRSLVQSANAAIIIADSEAKILTWNRGAQKTFGYLEEEVVGRSLTMLMPERYRERHMAGFARLQVTGKAHILGKTVELHGLRRDGSEFPLELSLDAWRTGGENFYSGIIRDLTERKTAEEALRQSEERFRKIFEEGPFGMAMIDLNQHFVRANPALCEILKYSEAELTQLTLLDLTHPDDAGRFQHLAEQMTQGTIPYYKIEKRYVKKDGELLWANLTRSMVRDGKGEHLYSLVMLEDITDRKRAEEERDRFFTLSSDMFFIGGLDGYFRQVNRAWQKTLGYGQAELLDVPFFELIHPESLSSAMREMGTLAGGVETVYYELRLRHADGGYRWTSWTVTPYTEEGLIYGIGRDITERKLAEEALRQARDLLEIRVKERTAELEAANKEIRSFAYIVSHDLRAPLINLRGFAAELEVAARAIHDHIAPALLHLNEASRHELGSALQQDIPEALDFINTAVSRMDRLTSAILNLSRLGRRDLVLEPIEMRRLVRETLKSLAHQIEQSQSQVTLGKLPVVTADRTAMEQIMGNLLANALIYLVPGRPGKIRIWGEQKEKEKETVYYVADNGRGIAAEDLPKLFQPFRRLGEPVAPGEGMGLASVQTLVRRHGGRITCESEVGVGTTFTFTISNHLNLEENGDG